MKIIGLTGGIATGKSTVAGMLAELGACVIDADQLARDAVAPGTQGLARLADLFGQRALNPDGSLDRAAVRKIVFEDPNLRKSLEEIIHPEVKQLAIKLLAEAAEAGHDVAVYMAPLLIEAKATDRVDEIWVVTLSQQEQLKRLMMRDKCSKEQALGIISSQMPLSEKERFGVVVIDNSGGLDETKAQVMKAWRERVMI